MTDTIYTRLNGVRKVVAYIKKDAIVDGKYQATTHDMVTARVRDHMIKFGVFLIPSVICSTITEVRKSSKGNPIYRYEATFDIRIVADGAEGEVKMILDAHGEDMGDKAPGKALSMAVKMAMLKVFNLETGENEESRVEGERRSREVVAHIKEEVNEYLEAGDSLAIYLLARSVGDTIWDEIHSSAPKGQKTSWKQKLADIDKQGLAILQAINEGINAEDALKIRENIDDMSEGGKRLLANHLGRERALKLAEIIK